MNNVTHEEAKAEAAGMAAKFSVVQAMGLIFAPMNGYLVDTSNNQNWNNLILLYDESQINETVDSNITHNFHIHVTPCYNLGHYFNDFTLCK